MYEPEVGKITSDLDSLEKILGIKNPDENVVNLVNSNNMELLIAQYTCSICPFSEDSKSKLEIHTNNVHNVSNSKDDDPKNEDSDKGAKVLDGIKEDIPVICGDCGIAFKTQGKMERHQKKYKCGEYALYKSETSSTSVKNCICDICGFSTNNEELVTKHSCTILPKINCDSCLYSTRLVTKMDMHKSFEHMAPLKCSQCDYQTQHNPKHPHSAKYSMSKHMDMHNVGTYDCFECGETFKVKQKLTYHIKSKHLQYICQDCNKEESSAYRLDQHIKKIHIIVQMVCTICDFIAPSKYLIEKHNKNAHVENA